MAFTLWPRLLLAGIGVSLSLAVSAQSSHEIDAQCLRFEHNLLPDTPIAGESGWSLASRMKRYHVPGFQVAVLTGGKLTWTKGYGVADPKTHRSVTPETLFDAGSISKAVTALAVVKLANEGRFTLDTPVNSLLRSWKLPENDFTRKTPVTLRHLLTHTAGTNVSGFWGYLENDPKPSLAQILDGLPPAANGAIRVEQEPGKSWRYSGGGYVVLQQMLEDVTGKPFAQVMEDTVCRPLGMTHSTFVQGLTPLLRRNISTPTSRASYFSGRRFHPHAAAAGLYTDATDLAHFVEAVYRSYKGGSEPFLSPEMARQMVEPTLFDRDPWDRSFVNRRNTQKDQAVGLMRISRNGAIGEAKYAYHDGLNAGFRSRVIFNAENGDGAILLYNSDGDEEFLQEATRGIALACGWKDWVDKPIVPKRLSATELERYCGRYRRGEDNIVTIRRDGLRLLWTDLYTATQPIYPIGDNRFEHRALFGHPSEFKSDTEGHIVSLNGWSRLADNTPMFASEHLLAGDLKRGTDALRRDDKLTGQRVYEIGSNLLETHEMTQAAVAVFRVGTEKAPGVSGAWDALGDALKRAGDQRGGVRAERRASALRSFQDQLGVAYTQGGVEAGKREYIRLRKVNGNLSLGALLLRLSRKFREEGKIAEADAILSLEAPELPSRTTH